MPHPPTTKGATVGFFDRLELARTRWNVLDHRFFAIESGQPAISRTKLDGLVRHYGMSEGAATEYFSLHMGRDAEHAAESRSVIAARLDGADEDRLLSFAEGALCGNWQLLDGVERASGS